MLLPASSTPSLPSCGWKEGFTPFWAVTRYEDVFFVSRNNEQFLNTRNSVLGPDAQLEFLNDLGIEPKTLIHMDGVEHHDHRGLRQCLVPAAIGGAAPGCDRCHRRRLRGEVPRPGWHL